MKKVADYLVSEEFPIGNKYFVRKIQDPFDIEQFPWSLWREDVRVRWLDKYEIELIDAAIAYGESK